MTAPSSKPSQLDKSELHLVLLAWKAGDITMIELKSAINSYIDKHYVTKEFWNESIKKQAAHHNSLTLKQVLGVIGEPTHKYCDAWEHGPSCQAEIAEDKLKDKLRQSAERIWS